MTDRTYWASAKTMRRKRRRARKARQRSGDGEMGVIYFIRAGSGAVKIGWTGGDVAARLADLQVGNAATLRCIASAKGTRDDEYDVHKLFRLCRIRGEWFDGHAVITELVELGLMTRERADNELRR